MKALGFVILTLISLETVASPVISPLHPSCFTAYDDARPGKLAEAVAGIAECGAASKPSLTVLRYEGIRILDRLGRHDEALTQTMALTDKAHFDTGLAAETGTLGREPLFEIEATS